MPIWPRPGRRSSSARTRCRKPTNGRASPTSATCWITAASDRRQGPGTLTDLVLPYGGALDRVAATILGREVDALPQLAHCTVVLPSMAAATELQRALAVRAGLPALLFPRIVTLRGWAAAVPGAQRGTSRTRRELIVFGALRGLRRFADASLWALAREVVQLADECTRHGVALPRDPESLSAALHAAYRARSNRALQFEAQLIHELWRALATGDQRDAEATYLLQLSSLAGTVSGTVYSVEDTEPTRAEREFFEACSERTEVVRFRRRVAADPVSRALVAGLDPFLGAAAPPESLDVRAASLRASIAHSPLVSRLTLHGASGLEDGARVAAYCIRRFLADGARRIALVALDRGAARRVRALLERSEVLMHDEAGWKLSTTSAGAMVMRWLEAIEDGFFHRTVVDLIHSPFVLADWPRDRRANAVLAIEAAQTRHDIVSGLERLAGALGASGDAAALVARLARARDRMRVTRASLTAWIDRLVASLDEIGALEGLRADHAGAQVVDALSRLRDELADEGTTLDRREFTRWLDGEFEHGTFRDVAVDSPIVVTQLADVALRTFDAVVFVGADAAHLPALGTPLLFGQAVRADLGLPGTPAAVADAARRFIGTIAACPRSVVIWLTEKSGAPNPESPFVAALSALHSQAWGGDLGDGALREAALAAEPPVPAHFAATAPRPAGPAATAISGHLPGRISVAAWQSFVDCPYRFFARSVLGLAEREEVREEADKGEYGSIVHAILDRFHRAHPVCTGINRDVLEADLRAVSDEEFASAFRRDPGALEWKVKWDRVVAAYVPWQLDREAAGWRYLQSETAVERPLAFAGGEVILNGRIDRLDVSTDGKGDLLDYKTQAYAGLVARAGDRGNHVQLSCYALLSPVPVGATEFVSLDAKEVRSVVPPDDPAEAAAAEAERLVRSFESMHAGTSLPANGVEDVCAHCGFGGLCRRGHWSEPEEA